MITLLQIQRSVVQSSLFQAGQ